MGPSRPQHKSRHPSNPAHAKRREWHRERRKNRAKISREEPINPPQEIRPLGFCAVHGTRDRVVSCVKKPSSVFPAQPLSGFVAVDDPRSLDGSMLLSYFWFNKLPATDTAGSNAAKKAEASSWLSQMSSPGTLQPPEHKWFPFRSEKRTFPRAIFLRGAAWLSY